MWLGDGIRRLSTAGRSVLIQQSRQCGQLPILRTLPALASASSFPSRVAPPDAMFEMPCLIGMSMGGAESGSTPPGGPAWR